MTRPHAISFLLASAALVVSTGGHAAAPAPAKIQPVLGSHDVPVITVEGLRFRDLDRNGHLDPYEDWRLAPAVRAADLIKRMTLPEKAGLMVHAANSGFFGPGGTVLRELAPPPPGALKPPVNVTGVPGFDRADKPSPYTLIQTLNVRWMMTSAGGTPTEAARWSNAIQDIAEKTRLGVPVMLTSDPVQTTNRLPGGALPPPDRKKITSSWPDQIGLGAIGDPAEVERFGRIAAAEYRAIGFRMIVNPMADTTTEPRWNRIPGTFGEDADLNAKLVAAYVRGFQGTHLGPDSVLTVVKHFPGDGPVKNGLDPHNPYGKWQVYPGGQMAQHLKPFRAGIAAGTAAVMPGYGIAVGTDTVAMNFSRKIVTGMLRGDLGFKGIVMSDWLHAMPWGVETLTKEQREYRMIAAGVDQFGGEHDPSHIIALVKAGQVSEARIDASAQRLLTPMFAIGLFENPYVDPEAAARIVNSPAFAAAGQDAQRRSIVLLRNQGAVLPLKPGARVFLSGFAAAPAGLGTPVASMGEADTVIVKVNAPYISNKTGQSFFTNTHEGPLVWTGADNEGELTQIRAAIASGKKVVVVVSMERPAVLSEFIGKVDGVVATFGSDDTALTAILTGQAKPTGHLPFDLPADEASVEGQKEDVPYDFARKLFSHGFGLTYP
ncbi:glycoside hydrolase family 3 protein [Novosphingobium rosa]|uniref:glycoside hydrolase family 3 protein n=1 Tax=Novosphingobium rosa TaxID=76978 RepID=UPI0008297930|nr:glycoside hydrolase family 3 N-terminal domain-containing protein [Novosphingobium rosa]